MKRYLFIFLVVTVTDFSSLFAQGFQPPAEGKAVIYFVRVSIRVGGPKLSVDYFQQDKFIGEVKGANYMRVECTPGKYLFWATIENKEFMTADLKAGATYIVIVDIFPGGWNARVGFNPLSVNDKELFERAKKIVNENPPVVTPQSRIEEKNKKLKDTIEKNLKMYEEEWKNTKPFKSILPDMNIPPDALK